MAKYKDVGANGGEDAPGPKYKSFMNLIIDTFAVICAYLSGAHKKGKTVATEINEAAAEAEAAAKVAA